MTLHHSRTAVSLRPMKFAALVFLIALALAPVGCTLGPTIDEQAHDETQRAQVQKKSDAFAKQLQQ